MLCLDGTAEIMPEDSSGPISQPVCQLARGCGESQSVSQTDRQTASQPASRVSCLRRGSRRQDTSWFPSIIITTVAVHKTQVSGLAHTVKN